MKKPRKWHIMALLILLVGTVAFAEGEEIMEGPLAGTEAASPLNWNTDKPVWKTGIVDDVRSEAIVIGDRSFRWSEYGTRFCNMENLDLELKDFKPGMEVTYVLAADRGKIETLIKGTPRK